MSDGAFRHAERTPGLVVLNKPDGKGGWADVTATEFAATVTAVAKGLIASGIELGDRVGILAATRYEWVVLDFAIWAAGGCTVAIYDSSSAEQARWILDDSGTKLLIVENGKHRATIADIEDGLDELTETLEISTGAVETLISRGKDLDDQVVTERRGQVKSASPATLIYTSGTTGRPKGVMLTHANLYAESAADRDRMNQFLRAGKRSLL
ncbi:AMP-binding protein, partial [Nocardia gipuzkoensis]